MTDLLALFAAVFAALYAAHHVGDYWVQTDHQAGTKGCAGRVGALACLAHVLTYTATQLIMLLMTFAAIGYRNEAGPFWAGLLLALGVSGGTHYLADRREHGVMLKLARLLPGKARFITLGVPREPRVIEAWFDCGSCEGRGAGGQASDESTNGRCWDCRGGGKLPSTLTITDNPSLGTGAWALDQSWHIALGCWVPALIIVVCVRFF